MTNSEDHHRKILRGNTESSSRNTIPNDLIIEILSRLTGKSIAICRCVSKQWKALLRSPDFTKSFLTRSSSRPRILITYQAEGKWHFFSAPHPRNLVKELTLVEPDYHMSFSGHPYTEKCLSVNGLLCLIDTYMLMEKRDRVPVICNPSTGQYVPLPKVKAKNNDLRSFFGYDPINKQYKVMCMTVTRYRQQDNSKEHQVLTIGKGKLSWKKIECSFPHYPDNRRDGICINGVCYYIARSVPKEPSLIACFDVRSEEFSFIKMAESPSLIYVSALVNYKGKLGLVVHNCGSHGELWVLDDTKKEKWSKHIFALPDEVYHEIIRSTWATDTGEIAWVLSSLTRPLSVFYSNLETKSVKRVIIEGIDEEALMGIHRFGAFIDHVENVMFL
ncbi:unnamed protein product [Microthlaspi erraticum]|uniref:F-box domain-containing protein n=1 Tax=Microthlaspi erraticum TaxID=1685480 RepID=A0A6D2KJY3_9BRAS|nr:unnamed protein product [Microthlaspi erraticum]